MTFNRHGECVGGLYKDAYLRFKEGKTAPGLSLDKWGVLSDGEVASLKAEGIFSVEQFAAMPRDRVVGVFPKVFVDAYERAIQFMASRDLTIKTDEQIEKIKSLKEENKALSERLAALEFAASITESDNKLKKNSKGKQ